MNKQTINFCKDLVRHKKVKQISPTLFEVENHSVKIQVKHGRTLVICSCQNDTKFSLESPICHHKLVVINYLFDKDLYITLDKILENYKKFKELKLNVGIDCFINDLENLKRIK